MSGFIDKNVVQMVLDNTLFQKNAEQTLSTLDKLKEALNFEGVVRGLDNLNERVKGVGMDALYNGVGKVQEGFSALDVVATRVLQNITDKVQNVATDLAKKITIEPLKAGLEEYETQINSVQTILANTNDALIEQGLTTEHDRIEKVNSVLDELNHYADMTIYNFTEMTRNIGTFTAAGVELDTAATAIQGIANLAAMSGSNSQQASTAMYQLSQAIASGSVKLQDWNSVVNAGMGGKLFQNELIDTAKAMGVVDEQFIALTEGTTTFRESLSSGWISAEVLTNTLEKFTAGTEGYTHAQVESMKELWRARGYSETQIEELTSAVHELTEEEEKNVRQKWYDKGFTEEQVNHIMEMGTAATDAATKVKTFTQLLDTVGEALQSGWTQSWEYIIGDFEQAKMLWTEVSDIMNLYIGKSADARNSILAEWSRAAYFYNEEGKLVRAVYNEAGELDKEASTQIVEDGKMVREEMGGRELVIQGLRNAFQGLMEVVIYFRDIWERTFTKGDFGDGEFRKNLTVTADTLIDLSRRFYDFTKNLKDSFGTAEKPSQLLEKLGVAFTYFATAARHAFDSISSIFNGIGGIFKALFQSDVFSTETLINLSMGVNQLAKMFERFGKAISDNFAGPAAVASKNLDGLKRFFNGLFSIFEEFKFEQLQAFDYGFDALGKIFEHLIGPGETISTLLGKIGDNLSIFGDALYKVFNNEDVSRFEGFFNDIVNSLKPFIDSIKEILGITANGKVTGITAFFNQLIDIMSGKFINIDLFSMFQKVIESILNVVKTLVSVATPIFQAFTNVFGPTLVNITQYLSEIIDRIHSFTESLVLNKETMYGVYNLFEGVFKVLQSIGNLLMNVVLIAWDNLAKIIGSFLPDSKSFADILTQWGKKLTDVSDIINSLINGENGVTSLSDIIGILTDKFLKLFEAFKNINLLEKFHEIIIKIGDGIKLALGGTEDMSLMDTIIEKIKGFFNAIKEILSDENGNLDFVKVFEAGGIIAALKKLYDFIKDIRERTNDLKGIFGFIDDFKEILEGVAKSFSDWTKAQNIKFIATAMLEMAGAMFILAMIDPVALGKAIVAMAGMFNMIERVVVILSSIDKGKVAAGAAAIAAIGTAMLQLAGAVVLIGNMELEDAIQGVVAIGVILQELVFAVKKLSAIANDVPKVAGAMIALAIALDLLVIPVKVLGGMNFEDLVKGLGAVAIMMTGLVGSVIALSKWGTSFKASMAIGLILIAEAISILAGAVRKISDLSWEDLAKGLAVFAVALIGMVGAAEIIDKLKLGDSLAKLGTSLIMLGIAMDLLAIGLKGIAGLTWEDLGKGLAVFAAALVGLGIASYAIDGKNLLMIGGAIFLVATAISELAITLNIAKIIGPVCDSIAFSIRGISDSLSSFASHASAQMFLQFLQDAILFLPKLAVGLVQAIGEMVVALGNSAAKIVGAVVTIGKEVLKGIVTLLPELFNVIKTFIDESIQVFISEVPRIFEALGVFFEQLWQFLTAQIPNFFTWLTAVFTEGFTFIQTEAPLLIETVRIILDSLLQVIITEAPRIGEAFLALLTTLLGVIQTAIPDIVTTLLTLISELLQRLAEFVPQMAQAALQIILGFLQAVADNIEAIVDAGISIALGFMRGIIENMPEIVDTAFKMLIGFIDGLALAIEENHDALFDAIGHLIKAIVEAILDGIGKIVDAAGKWFTGEDGNGGILGAIGGFFQQIFDAGANLVQGFIDGLTSMPGRLWEAACGIAEDAWKAITGTLDEHSPSRLTYGGGKNFVLGFTNAIEDYTSKAVSVSAAMAYGVLDAFDSTMNSDSQSYAPSITPVIDDSNIKNGVGRYLGDINNTITGTASISGTLKADAEMKAQLEDILSKPADYSEIIGKMTMLDRNLNNLTDILSKMQIVLDTGTLVGQLTPGIDMSLGRTAILSGRGI